jgi:hypothetical protein
MSTHRSETTSQVHTRARRGTEDIGEATEKIYGKRVEDWDDEELARGRPRNKSGNFTGPAPTWLGPSVQEEVERRFRERIRAGLHMVVLSAPDVLSKLMMNEETTTDERTNRIYWQVSPAVRADVAKYLVDHVMGKPTQPVDVNANVKLLGMLATAVVQGDGDEPAVGFADRVDWQSEDPNEADEADGV